MIGGAGCVTAQQPVWPEQPEITWLADWFEPVVPGTSSGSLSPPGSGSGGSMSADSPRPTSRCPRSPRRGTTAARRGRHRRSLRQLSEPVVPEVDPACFVVAAFDDLAPRRLVPFRFQRVPGVVPGHDDVVRCRCRGRRWPGTGRDGAGTCGSPRRCPAGHSPGTGSAQRAGSPWWPGTLRARHPPLGVRRVTVRRRAPVQRGGRPW